jgi:hypothetical protein
MTMAINGTNETQFQKAASGFRKHLPDLNTPRFIQAEKEDAYEYSARFNKERLPPWLHSLTQTWEKLYQESFKGVTTDGRS